MYPTLVIVIVASRRSVLEHSVASVIVQVEEPRSEGANPAAYRQARVNHSRRIASFSLDDLPRLRVDMKRSMWVVSNVSPPMSGEPEEPCRRDSEDTVATSPSSETSLGV